MFIDAREGGMFTQKRLLTLQQCCSVGGHVKSAAIRAKHGSLIST